MDRAILHVLSTEVRNRRCPGCGASLRHADVAARFSARQKVTLHFRCRHCVFEGGGEIELTDQMYEEANQSPSLDRPQRELDPISADEMLAVHEQLAGWSGGLAQLVDR
jgi:hypothetical protein